MNRQRIIEEARKLFVVQGIKATTMDDIAKYVGISKRTIYEHFTDKKELIVSIMDNMRQTKDREDEELFSRTDNVLEGMLEIMKNKRFLSSREIRVMTEIRRYYPDIIVCKWKEGIAKIEKMFTKGIEEGVFKKEMNPKTAAYLFSEQSKTLFAELCEKIDMDISSLRLLSDLFLNFLRGISTPKGVEIIEKHNLMIMEGYDTSVI
ncbi:MAG: TetR/AcrR family transcriptional regulator [Prevotellaceae bacterium]|jgi:AcrR family transcriptional regulator|nr:TetR/AcrR family transcriptional regulator [Prevotellaceae bacterium]